MQLVTKTAQRLEENDFNTIRKPFLSFHNIENWWQERRNASSQ
jgi:hypothetical protein